MSMIKLRLIRVLEFLEMLLRRRVGVLLRGIRARLHARGMVIGRPPEVVSLHRQHARKRLLRLRRIAENFGRPGRIAHDHRLRLGHGHVAAELQHPLLALFRRPPASGHVAAHKLRRHVHVVRARQIVRRQGGVVLIGDERVVAHSAMRARLAAERLHAGLRRLLRRLDVEVARDVAGDQLVRRLAEQLLPQPLRFLRKPVDRLLLVGNLRPAEPHVAELLHALRGQGGGVALALGLDVALFPLCAEAAELARRPAPRALPGAMKAPGSAIGMRPVTASGVAAKVGICGMMSAPKRG